LGLVESALKDRWLYVTAAAGRQTIYFVQAAHHDRQRPEMRYLPFQRQQYFERHAIVELAGSRIMLLAIGATYVNGQPVPQGRDVGLNLESGMWWCNRALRRSVTKRQRK